MPLSLDFLLAQGVPFPSSCDFPPGITRPLPLLLLPSQPLQTRQPSRPSLFQFSGRFLLLVAVALSFSFQDFKIFLSSSSLPPLLPFLVNFAFQAHLPHVLLPFMWDWGEH